jgi:hypothetical protein
MLTEQRAGIELARQHACRTRAEQGVVQLRLIVRREAVVRETGAVGVRAYTPALSLTGHAVS